jgi:hypothetical protein
MEAAHRLASWLGSQPGLRTKIREIPPTTAEEVRAANARGITAMEYRATTSWTVDVQTDPQELTQPRIGAWVEVLRQPPTDKEWRFGGVGHGGSIGAIRVIPASLVAVV